MRDWDVVEIPEFPDEERGGILAVAEIGDVTGNAFDAARRVYYIINSENRVIERGGHYHPAGGKQEFWLVPTGRAVVDLHSAQKCQIGLVLNKRTEALFIPSDVWHSLKLDPDTVLISVASTNFDPEEAISDIPNCKCGG